MGFVVRGEPKAVLWEKEEMNVREEETRDWQRERRRREKRGGDSFKWCTGTVGIVHALVQTYLRMADLQTHAHDDTKNGGSCRTRKRGRRSGLLRDDGDDAQTSSPWFFQLNLNGCRQEGRVLCVVRGSGGDANVLVVVRCLRAWESGGRPSRRR